MAPKIWATHGAMEKSISSLKFWLSVHRQVHTDFSFFGTVPYS